MNKKPVFLRLAFALVVIAIFAVSIHPITQRDFYDTFTSLLKKEDAKIKELIATAKSKQAADPSLYASVAVEQTANEQGLDLKEYVQAKDVTGTRDVISLVKKHASSSIRLGLDLHGGVEFILRLEKDKQSDSAEPLDTAKTRDQAIEILRNRLESQNIYESEISPFGEGFITLKAPIVAKDERVKLQNLIEMSAKLQFRLVHKDNDTLVSQFMANPRKFIDPVGYERMTVVDTDRDNKPVTRTYFVQIKPEMTGKNVVEAFPTVDEFGRRKIILRFNAAGGARFGEVTRNNVGRLLAIVLDDKLYCAPSINQAIEGGSAEISGNFSREEAENISNALVSGSLPIKIKVEGVFETAPTLGRENVASGIYAGIIALVLVMLFMGVYYVRAGIVANIALAVNIVLVLGAMAAFSATLTLPGIAGIILTIGMAVDANVIIYERIREELNKGKSLASSIDQGYANSFSTILDSNLTTLLTALILMWLGTGPIKGFAVTLSIGIATSMFTALFLTRLTFDIITRFFNPRSMKMCAFLSNPKIDFMSKSKIAATASVVLIVISLAVIAIRGGNLLGVDFTGGTQVAFNYQKYVSQQELDKTLAGAGIDAKVSYRTSAMSAGEHGDRQLSILIREKDKGELNKVEKSNVRDTLLKLLNDKFPEAKYTEAGESVIGGQVGWEFTKSAMLAVFLALLGIILYISIRFEFAFAIAAIIALIHDVIIATGIFAIIGMLGGGREITLSVVAALLTIIGYSLNDTIVIFDRIREDIAIEKGRSFKELVNMSINQTLSRTLLTSLTTLMVLIVLMLIGGVAINDFVLVMLLGVLVGTYSSVFIATPVVVLWHRRIGKHIA